MEVHECPVHLQPRNVLGMSLALWLQMMPMPTLSSSKNVVALLVVVALVLTAFSMGGVVELYFLLK
jgi:hypothetical protein